MKNRHWLQDVVAGAAIGIISTKLAYALVNKLTSADETAKNCQKPKQPSDPILLINKKR
jgi:membrane-associated phospholipid phosphatase